MALMSRNIPPKRKTKWQLAKEKEVAQKKAEELNHENPQAEVPYDDDGHAITVINLIEMWKRNRQILKSKPLPTYLEFAREITLPDGKSKRLKYRPESHQCQLHFLKELENGWTECTVAKPVQDGGTLVTIIPLFRRVIYQSQTVVLAYPTQDSVSDIWTTKVVPILQSHGGVASKNGAGMSGGAPRVIQFLTGGQFILRSSGGRMQSGQASVTGDALMLDELDDFEDLHRAQLLCKRVEEAPDPLIMNVCTVKRQQGSLILQKWESGTKSRSVYPCPECHTYQTIEWEQVKWKTTGKDGQFLLPGSGAIECSHCKELLFETDRMEMLAKGVLLHDGQTIDCYGVVSGEPNNRKHFSYLWNRLESPRKTLESTIEAYMEAKMFLEQYGNHGHMKSFYQDYITRPYTGDLDELDSAGLINHNHLITKSSFSEWGPSLSLTDTVTVDRTSTGLYSRHIAVPPEDAKYTIVTIDVQHNRIYWVATAFNDQGTQYDFAWGFEFARVDRGPSSEYELFMMLDKFLVFITTILHHTQFVLGGIDCGDQTDSIRTWVASHPMWRAVRGTATKMKADNHQDIDGISYIRDGVIYIHAENVRNMVHSALRRPNNAPGTIQFPNGIGQNQSGYFRHLVSVQTSIDPKTKKLILVKGSGREDWLDCRIYNYALMTGFLQAMRIAGVIKSVDAVKNLVKQQLATPIGEGTDATTIKQAIKDDPSTAPAVIIPAMPSQETAQPPEHHKGGPISLGGHMRHPANAPGMRDPRNQSPSVSRKTSIGFGRSARRSRGDFGRE